ncbi:MAG TPA: hypothetical protein VNO30_07620 [Kofleriaceae bacterium]|nr:hypothetical protein [Kofleriaceae bacterium]
MEPATAAFPRWVWLAGAGALLVIGWVFILMVNSFHFTPSVVFVCLGYGAGVASVYTLFRTGAAAVSSSEADGDDTGWDRPVGERGELEREKKALLKAIKEAEFDLQMGKLSKSDAETIIAEYRARAIAVIRELDREEGADASVRDQIEREVRARLEVAKTKKSADAERRATGKKGKKPSAAEAAKKAEKTVAKAEAAAEAAEEKAEAAAAKADAVSARAEEAAAAAEAAAEEAAEKAEASEAAKAAAEAPAAEVKAEAAAAAEAATEAAAEAEVKAEAATEAAADAPAEAVAAAAAAADAPAAAVAAAAEAAATEQADSSVGAAAKAGASSASAAKEATS